EHGLLWLADGQGSLWYAAAGPFERRSITGTALAQGDFDGDGHPDLYFGLPAVAEDHLLMNRGDGSFADAPPGALPLLPEPGHAAIPLDFDGDGDLDLMVATARRWSGAPGDHLLANNGSGMFRPGPATLPPTDEETRSFA